MSRSKRVAVVGVVAFLLVWARAARADDAEPPSAGILGAGVALAVGGAALNVYEIHRYVNETGNDFGTLTLSSLGSLVMQGGGALETYWAWRLGEHRLATDLRDNVPLESRRPMALGALAVGAVALVATYVGIGFVFAKTFTCALNQNNTANTAPGDIQHCANDALVAVTIIDLAAGAVLLVAAPVAGYGFAYDSAAQREGHKLASLRYLVAPTVVPGGAGAALVGRF
jgi:hypothetical protein